MKDYITPRFMKLQRIRNYLVARSGCGMCKHAYL